MLAGQVPQAPMRLTVTTPVSSSTSRKNDVAAVGLQRRPDGFDCLLDQLAHAQSPSEERTDSGPNPATSLDVPGVDVPVGQSGRSMSAPRDESLPTKSS